MMEEATSTRSTRPFSEAIDEPGSGCSLTHHERGAGGPHHRSSGGCQCWRTAPPSRSMNDDTQRFVRSLIASEFTVVTPQLLRFVADLFEDPTVDAQQIAPAAVELLRRAGSFDGPLLHALLRNAVVCDLEFERWARATRRDLMANAVQEDSELMRSLAAQAEATGYVWADDDWNLCPSRGELKAPVARMDQPSQQSIDEEEAARRELERPLELDPVSALVRRQYEKAPFPLWRRLRRKPARPFAELLAKWLGPAPAPAQLPVAPAVLIAGCGTGHDALVAATRYEEARVTAVDLSVASLAYATLMARQEKVTNVTFLHADLLSMALGARFDVVESHGVLHHLADPEKGFAILVNALAPAGVLGISVYSALGRQRFDAVRRRYNLSPSADDDSIRRMRDILAIDEPWLTEMREFYVLPELRDLLYHPHERPFTLPQIQQLIDDHGCEFLGFERLPPEVREAFASEEPDAGITDLGRWASFEQRNPMTFQSMYRFWVRRRS